MDRRTDHTNHSANERHIPSKDQSPKNNCNTKDHSNHPNDSCDEYIYNRHH